MELTDEEKARVKTPKRWREQYELLCQLRREIITPVDTMGRRRGAQTAGGCAQMEAKSRPTTRPSGCGSRRS